MLWPVGATIALALLGPAVSARAVSTDVAARAHLRIIGVPGSSSGHGPVVGLGDVNGDGVPDVAVGAGGATPKGRKFAQGAVYVVFGRRDKRTIDVRALGSDGFRIDGALSDFMPDPEPAGEGTASSIAAIGDVNGDGLADVAVGAPSASHNLRLGAGSVYIVFGKTSTDPVDLQMLGGEGYRIDGSHALDHIGASLAGAGDVNGDGRPDLLVGGQGIGYVVFGRRETTSLDLRSLGDGGYAIEPGGQIGRPDSYGNPPYLAVAPAGDINRDGHPDAVVNVPVADPNGGSGPVSSRVFVVPGHTSSAAARLDQLEPGGYEIGLPKRVFAGAASGLSDVNGDGIPDLGIAAQPAPESYGPGPAADAALYVVFGQTSKSHVDLRRLGGGGYRIGGLQGLEEGFDSTVPSVVGLGDLNHDGLGDVAVGVPGADNRCRTDSGSVYVLFGRSSPGALDARRLSGGGYRLDGTSLEDRVGVTLAGAGDINGDGLPDIVLDADRFYEQEVESQAAFVVPGASPPPAQRNPAPSSPRCLRLRVLDNELNRIVRTGKLRVRVISKLPTAYLTLELRLARSPRGTYDVLADGPDVGFTRPGARTVTFRLTDDGRRILSARTRVRVTIAASGTGATSPYRDSRITVTLRRAA